VSGHAPWHQPPGRTKPAEMRPRKTSRRLPVVRLAQ
jgi:hypothetical protein